MMTPEEEREWDELRNSVLREQRVCAWCKKKFGSGDALAEHIIAERKEGNGHGEHS